MASLSINEPIGAISFLTYRPASCIHIEPIGFFSMLNQIPQPLLQPRRPGDLLLPDPVVMAPLTARASKQFWTCNPFSHDQMPRAPRDVRKHQYLIPPQ